jgi:hypothetical protein
VGARTVVEDALGIGVLHEEGIQEFDHFSSPALHDGHNLLFLLLSGESSKAMLNLNGPYGLRQVKTTVIFIANPSAPSAACQRALRDQFDRVRDPASC